MREGTEQTLHTLQGTSHHNRREMDKRAPRDNRHLYISFQARVCHEGYVPRLRAVIGGDKGMAVGSKLRPRSAAPRRGARPIGIVVQREIGLVPVGGGTRSILPVSTSDTLPAPLPSWESVDGSLSGSEFSGPGAPAATWCFVVRRRSPRPATLRASPLRESTSRFAENQPPRFRGMLSM